MPHSNGDATPEPLVANANQREEVDVAKHSVEVILFQVKDEAALQFGDRTSMTYKYSIHTRPSGKDEVHLDPDLEIDKP